MAVDFSPLGAALGGIATGPSIVQYATGAHLGAETQAALATAQAARDKAAALAELQKALIADKMDPTRAGALSTMARGGVNPEEFYKGAGQADINSFRTEIASPGTSEDRMQQLLAAQASAPVAPIHMMGTGAYIPTMHPSAGPQALPAGMAHDPAQNAPGMQYARSLRLLDHNDQAIPGLEDIVSAVEHPITKTVVVAGVPTLVTLDPLASLTPEQHARYHEITGQKLPVTTPAPATPGANPFQQPLGDSLAAPAPVASPAGTPGLPPDGLPPVAPPTPHSAALGNSIAPPAAPVPAAPKPAAPAPKPAAAPATSTVRPLTNIDTVAANAKKVAGAQTSGKLEATAASNLDENVQRLADLKDAVDTFTKEPGFNAIHGSTAGSTLVPESVLTIGSDERSNAMTKFHQIEGAAFLNSAQAAKGVFSRITNMEAQKLAAAYTSATNRHQTPEAAREAYGHLQTMLDRAIEIQYGKAGLPPPSGAATSAAPKAAPAAPAAPAAGGPKEGDTATNPTTGETAIYHNGAWVIRAKGK